jgi:ketosteroid isomerase-like protein
MRRLRQGAYITLHSNANTAGKEPMMTTIVKAAEDQGLTEAREQVRLALTAMASGDPEPYVDLWVDLPEVTLFGAWGPIEQGYAQLTSTFRWVGSRFTGGDMVPEDVVVHASGDLAYTVGFTRGDVSVDGGERRPMTIRVTHIYRRIEGVWRLVHRHADFPPADQRLGTD